jgi:hypothetical protein
MLDYSTLYKERVICRKFSQGLAFLPEAILIAGMPYKKKGRK